LEELLYLIPEICKHLNANLSDVKRYDQSFTAIDGSKLLMIKVKNKKIIIFTGQAKMYNELEGEEVSNCKLCWLNKHNRLIFNKYMDYTTPKAFGKDVATIGLGDRLGLTSAAHIKALNNRKIKPILAQQSKRELDLTGRTYDDILDAACYAVIQEGYKGGYGADGDHLKDEMDIKSALNSGVSMITLDCSEKIDNSVEVCEEEELFEQYSKISAEIRRSYEDKYINRKHAVGNYPIVFSKEILAKNMLIYGKVIEFIAYIYNKYIQCAGRKIDFEISLDETCSQTSVQGHYFVANELVQRNIVISSMAPRFVGDFQKGIDYIGDLNQFEEDLKIHTYVADHFGYKLSIHSGSDKFSVFRIIGKYTGGRFHIKTSGTNWLEAVRVISKNNPGLYRRMHKYALDHFNEAKAYYHVTTDLLAIKDIDSVSDNDLMLYMDDDNARQLLHITYGLLLKAKNNGISMFRYEIFETLDKYSDEYEKSIINHIGRHLDLLSC
jgi:tagaturonate epimerase